VKIRLDFLASFEGAFQFKSLQPKRHSSLPPYPPLKLLWHHFYSSSLIFILTILTIEAIRDNNLKAQKVELDTTKLQEIWHVASNRHYTSKQAKHVNLLLTWKYLKVSFMRGKSLGQDPLYISSKCLEKREPRKPMEYQCH